jgi:hypothetical protein
MATKKTPYINRFTGNVVVVSKQHAKKLSEDYSEVEFVRNDKGKRVMRLQLENAVVDISENEDGEEVIDGIGSTK